MSESITADTIRQQRDKLLHNAQADLQTVRTELARHREQEAALMRRRDDLKQLVRELTPSKRRGKLAPEA